MKSCTHCGTPAQTIKSIRRLRSEIERLTNRYNDEKASKHEEVSKRRALEKKFQALEKKHLKQQNAKQEVETELDKVTLKASVAQKSANRLRRERNAADIKYRKEIERKSIASDKLKSIKALLRG